MKQLTDKKPVRGIVASAVGIACNVLLSAAKIAVGALLGLISVIADGFNNLGDCCSGIVALVSVCVAAKPADKQHPYGHRRAEYIAAMTTGFFVLVVAAELLKESIVGIVEGAQNSVHWVVYVVLGASVAVKALMFAYYLVTARKTGSAALKAAATDSLCDCIATAAVIVGALLAERGIAADGWAGMAVALFVGWQGVRIVHEASSKLMGQAPDAEEAERIKATICACDGVLGVHDLHVFTYGDGVAYATVHVEMDSRTSALRAHEILDELEHRVHRELGVELTTHLDPIDTEDKQAAELEQKIRDLTQKMAYGVEIHDFRMVRGRVDKLVFDAVVPFECKLKDAEVERLIVAAVATLGDYDVAVTVERG